MCVVGIFKMTEEGTRFIPTDIFKGKSCAYGCKDYLKLFSVTDYRIEDVNQFPAGIN